MDEPEKEIYVEEEDEIEEIVTEDKCENQESNASNKNIEELCNTKNNLKITYAGGHFYALYQNQKMYFNKSHVELRALYRLLTQLSRHGWELQKKLYVNKEVLMESCIFHFTIRKPSTSTKFRPSVVWKMTDKGHDFLEWYEKRFPSDVDDSKNFLDTRKKQRAAKSSC